jgi:hypothetical protein
MEFLKKHYEKIILVAVLLILAATAVWMGAAIGEAQRDLKTPVDVSLHLQGKLVAPIDLTPDQRMLSQVTNAPPVVLSGEHNLFNPVTWKRKSNGDLIKILKTGPDALTVTNIIPLYTVIAYDHPSGNGPIYIMTVQQHSGRKTTEYVKKGEKTRQGLYIIRGIKGAADDPTDLELEIADTQEDVWITKDKPYKQVDGYLADMKYDPESLVLLKKRVNDIITLDDEMYKIVEITNNLVRVQSNKTKVTTIPWNEKP